MGDIHLPVSAMRVFRLPKTHRSQLWTWSQTFTYCSSSISTSLKAHVSLDTVDSEDARVRRR